MDSVEDNLYIFSVEEEQYRMLEIIADVIDMSIDETVKRMIKFIYITQIAKREKDDFNG